MVEQNVDFALELADQYLVMKQGSIAAQGMSSAADARAAVESELALA